MALRKYWTLAAESPLLSSSVPLRKASTALPGRARSWTETTVSLRGDCARVPVENGKTITVKKKAAGFMRHHLDVVAFSVRGEAQCARTDERRSADADSWAKGQASGSPERLTHRGTEKE